MFMFTDLNRFIKKRITAKSTRDVISALISMYRAFSDSVISR